MIERLVAWLTRDTNAAEQNGYARGLDRASEIIRKTQWSAEWEGKSTLNIVNELLEKVAVTIDAESRRG